MKLTELKTNHRLNPLGIDGTPYFNWKLTSDKNNVIQQSYRIVVTKEYGKETVWDSGEVRSKKNAFVTYEGRELLSKTKYNWSVTVKDNYNEEDIASGNFETGLLSETDWKANWVESTIPRVSASEYQFGNTYAPVLFTRKIMLNKRPVAARCYATAYGVYRMYINGERPDEREFAPEFTSYAHKLYYQTYDVTSLLKEGENTLQMYVGDGWYFSTQASPVAEGAHEAPAVLFQMEIRYSDGTIETVVSDGTETCELSYIVYSDLFQGEKQDFTLENHNTFLVEKQNYGYSILGAQPMEPIKAVKEIPVTDLFTSPAGELIVDFGQILAGRARIHIDAPRGTKVTFEYFEVLSAEGNYINTMFAPQKDTVIVGDVPLLHEALFTFHGFRYIKVTGLENVKKEDFTAVLLTSEKENLGEFTCSDERMNRLYKNVRWSQYNNMMSVPTDCPTREKAGYTGDLLIYAKTALVNEDMTPFLESWLSAVKAEQAEDGVVMITAPYAKLYHNLMLNTCKKFGDDKTTGVAGWSDAIVWVPYDMYRVTGNTKVLRENYDAMKKWCDYIIKTAEEKRGYKDIPYEYDRYLWNTGFHFGEWLVPSRPDNTGEQYGICKESAFYIAPYFGYMTLKKMAEISGVLKDTDSEIIYLAAANKMKYAIQKGIMRAGLLPDYLMGAYILAFAFDLVPDDLYETYKEKLITLIHKQGNCLDTGFLATPFILDVLMNLGEKELAATILWQDKMPSWLYEVDHGATCIWEAWDADEATHTNRFVSFDHYAFGCVDDFIIRKIVGIDSDTPGYSHLIICPDNMGRLRNVRRIFKSENGDIRVEWDEEHLTIEIPCNTTASVTWKNQTVNVGSGKYTF